MENEAGFSRKDGGGEKQRTQEVVMRDVAPEATKGASSSMKWETANSYSDDEKMRDASPGPSNVPASESTARRTRSLTGSY